MAFKGSDVSPEKHTGFTYKSKEIVLSKTRGRPMNGIATRQGWYSDKKRIEVATVYAVTGSAERTGELTGVPKSTVSGWTREDWFKRLLDDIRAENDHIIDAKTTEIVVSALEQLQERLLNGDAQVLKDGTVIRKPISARDLSIVMAINVDKRQLLRGKPTSRSEQVTSQDINNKLGILADAFKKIVKPKEEPLEIQDVEYTEIKSERTDKDNACKSQES